MLLYCLEEIVSVIPGIWEDFIDFVDGWIGFGIESEVHGCVIIKYSKQRHAENLFLIVTVKPPIKMTQRFEPSIHQSNAFILAWRETMKEHPNFQNQGSSHTHTHLTGIIIDQT